MQFEESESSGDLTFVITGKGSQVSSTYNPPLYLTDSYEMCMLSLHTYNSIPNVTESNNRLVYNVKPEGEIPEWKIIYVPEGTYDIDDLSKFFDERILELEGENHGLYIFANSNTLKVHLKATMDIDFSAEKSIGPLLGLPSKIIFRSTIVHSERVVDINHISAIDIMCNVVDGSYVNEVPSHILYHFYPNVPPGFKIIETPQEKIYMPVNTNVLNNIIIRAVDQNGRLINLRGEDLTVYLRLRKSRF